MAISEEQKKKLAAEFMMQGVKEGDAAAAAEVLTIYLAFRDRSEVNGGEEAMLTLAVWLSRHTLS